MDAKTIGFTVAFSILAAFLTGLGTFWYLRRRHRSITMLPDPVGSNVGQESSLEVAEARQTQDRRISTEIQPTTSETSELPSVEPAAELGTR
jgi:hypothetical protein